MGIFSFGKKRADGAAGDRDRARVARNERVGRASGGPGAGGAARMRRGNGVGQEAMLDPTLPEKQRARRRLVGAIALVLAAVIVLPMVLDSHPRPVSNDIAIAIPQQQAADTARGDANRPGAAALTARDADDATDAATADAAADAARADTAPTDSPSSAQRGAAAGQAQTASVPAQGGSVGRRNAAATARAASANATTAKTTTAKTTSANATSARATSAKAAAPDVSLAAPTPSAARSPSTTPPPAAVTPGSQYVVQLGTFPSAAAARDWVGKLKNIGVPAYIDRASNSDGSTAWMLRAGPFADRSTAQAAVSKVRQAGLAQTSR